MYIASKAHVLNLNLLMLPTILRKAIFCSRRKQQRPDYKDVIHTVLTIFEVQKGEL